jgi:hypothetical protein
MLQRAGGIERMVMSAAAPAAIAAPIARSAAAIFSSDLFEIGRSLRGKLAPLVHATQNRDAGSVNQQTLDVRIKTIWLNSPLTSFSPLVNSTIPKLWKTRHRRLDPNCCSDLRMERPEPHSVANTKKWDVAQSLGPGTARNPLAASGTPFALGIQRRLEKSCDVSAKCGKFR